MINCLNDLNKELFSNYESIDYFLDLLLENFQKIKTLEYYINQKFIKSIEILIDIDKNKKDELLKKETFRNMIIKIIYFLLNTDGKYNPKNSVEVFQTIKTLLEKYNEDNFTFEIFKIFFIELYDLKNVIFEKYEIVLKYQFLINCKDKQKFLENDLKPLDSQLFEYLALVIEYFTTLTPQEIIVECFRYYFNKCFYLYNEIFLIENKNLYDIEAISKRNQKYFLLCNFFHIFQSKKIFYKFYLYLIKYARQNNNSKIFDLFPDLKATLINIFYLCPYPFYFDLIIDIFKDENNFNENQLYFNEIIEAILNIGLIHKNNENKYISYFFNIIELVKIFRYISIKIIKFKNSFNKYKLKQFFYELIKKLKECLFIFSPYLLELDNNNNNNDDNSQKTILELCFLSTISFFFYDNDNSEQNTKILNLFYDFFLNNNNNNNNDNSYGKTIFFAFDTSNNLLNYNNNIKNKNLELNEDFEKYLNDLNKYKIEEKSLLITLLIYMYKLEHSIGSLFFSEKINSCLNLFFEDLLILINNSSGLKKTRSYSLYDSIIDSINNIKKSNPILNKDDILTILEKIFLKNKKQQFEENINYCQLLENDKKNAEFCYFKNKCLLHQEKQDESFYEEPDVKKEIIILNSYFDIEMIDNVKCLKKDLLLKDCSIYFNDIFFNDKFFKKLKKSFNYNYKQFLLDDDYNNELLNYPSKLKNFSSNKYATPKIFCSCDTNHYNNNNFSIFYPIINKTLIKCNPFPSLPSHYQYFQNLLINNNNFILFSFSCEYISIKDIIFGNLYLYNTFILFKNKDELDDYDTNIKYIYSSGKKELSLKKKIIFILYNEIEEIITRTFVYNKQAFEIFLKNGKSYFFNLFENSKLLDIYKILKQKIEDNNQELDFNIIEDPKKYFEEKNITKQWEKNDISNYQYLLYLNKYSGRTFNDINQYPIFPWVMLPNDFFNNIKNNNNDNKNEKDTTTPLKLCFRDMNNFMMTQTEFGKEQAIENYKFSSENKISKGIHFTLHYSTGGYILLYLMRISPFRDNHIKFQGGKFDDPNRLIDDIDEFLNIISQSKDNRELIPELFTSCEFFYNLNYIYIGKRSINNLLVNNLHVHSLFNSIEYYIYYNRLFLNNNIKDNNKLLFPKCEIYNWIDLIFGYKQYPTSFNGLNKFEKYSYRQCVDLPNSFQKYKEKKLKTEKIINKIKLKISHILNFGQCPEQLFKSKHSSPDKIDLSLPHHRQNKKFNLKNKDITIITFWLSINQIYIYFLTKNKNSIMSILVYDEKFCKKCEIFIDKIKMFKCENEYDRKYKEESDKIGIKSSFLKEKRKMKMFKEFVFIDYNQYGNDYYIKDLSELYILNPRDAIMDICKSNNIYFFVGRNKNNSIKIYYTQKNHNKIFNTLNTFKKKENNTSFSPGKLIGIIKTDSFISVISQKDSEFFFSGHNNGKLMEWKIEYKEIHKHKLSFKNHSNNIISNIILKREIIAHNYTMITSINYNEKYNIILTSDKKGTLFIRKYYNLELLTKILINNSDFCFIKKIYLNDYDIICTINYNSIKFKNYICFYSLNGILIETSDNYCSIDTCLLKNGKIIFNCLNQNNLYIFGFNDYKSKDNKIGIVNEDNILKNIDPKNEMSSITNFVIENNIIYILLKNGKFIKANYNKLNSLSYGVDKFD